MPLGIVTVSLLHFVLYLRDISINAHTISKSNLSLHRLCNNNNNIMFNRKVPKINLLSRHRINHRFLNRNLPDIHVAPGSTKYNPFKCQGFFFGNKASDKSQLYLLWWISWYFLQTSQQTLVAMSRNKRAQLTLAHQKGVGKHTWSINKGVSSDSSPLWCDSISLCWAVALLRAEEKNSPA